MHLFPRGLLPPDTPIHQVFKGVHSSNFDWKFYLFFLLQYFALRTWKDPFVRTVVGRHHLTCYVFLHWQTEPMHFADSPCGVHTQAASGAYAGEVISVGCGFGQCCLQGYIKQEGRWQLVLWLSSLSYYNFTSGIGSENQRALGSRSKNPASKQLPLLARVLFPREEAQQELRAGLFPEVIKAIIHCIFLTALPGSLYLLCPVLQVTSFNVCFPWKPDNDFIIMEFKRFWYKYM